MDVGRGFAARSTLQITYCLFPLPVLPHWQDFRVGLETSTDPSENKEKLSNVPSSAPACIG